MGALLALGTGPAGAASLSVVNPGFEQDVLLDGNFTLALSGWSSTDPTQTGAFNPTTAQYTGEAPEGQNVAFSNTGGPTLSQILADVLTANTVYTLEILVGHRLDAPFPGYQVQLVAGGTVLAEDDNTLSPTPGSFALSTVQYTALPGDANLGQALEIHFRSLGQQVNFDDVRLDATAVPEPSTLGLTLLGTLGLAGWARRRPRA